MQPNIKYQYLPVGLIIEYSLDDYEIGRVIQPYYEKN